MADFHGMFGIAAGVIEFISLPIYVHSILNGATKPDRVTWWVLALISTLIAISYYASGARDTLWLPIVYAMCMLIIALLSLKYGEGPITLNFLDRISLIGALLSAAVWWMIHSPVPALFLNVATEFIGLIPTIIKSYRRPWTESKAAWIIGTIAALLNILAISEWTLVIAFYPIYVFVTDVIIMYFLVRKKIS